MPPDLLIIARRLATVLETAGVITDEHPAALQLITLVQRLDLADLQAERDQLAAELEALKSAPPALPAPVMLAEPSEPATKRRFRAKQQPVSGGLICRECERGFKNLKALGAHRARAHGTTNANMQAERVTVKPAPVLHLVEDDLPFVCSICRSDTFARDLHQPDRCVRCAKRGSDAA